MTDKQTEQYLIMQALEEDCFIDTSKTITYPPVAISMGEKLIKTNHGDELLPIAIGTYGSFSFTQAPPKSHKTFFISILASVYLSGQNHFGGSLRGRRENRGVLHIDTEQGKWHAQKCFKRTTSMAGMSKNYYTFGLRTINFKQRIEFIDYCLEHKYKDIGVIIIDGIADLVSDDNNIEESNACVQKIMDWRCNYNCHIITVIHSNFGSDKPTGHLGSFLEKKAESQIQLEANTQNKGWITVKSKRSRGYSFETFSFKINEIGLPEIIGDLYDPLK